MSRRWWGITCVVLDADTNFFGVLRPIWANGTMHKAPSTPADSTWRLCTVMLCTSWLWAAWLPATTHRAAVAPGTAMLAAAPVVEPAPACAPTQRKLNTRPSRLPATAQRSNSPPAGRLSTSTVSRAVRSASLTLKDDRRVPVRPSQMDRQPTESTDNTVKSLRVGRQQEQQTHEKVYP